MEDTTAASVGFVLAGLAFAAAFLPWPSDPLGLPAVGAVASPAGATIAGVALVAFGLRRYGLVGRRVGAPLAGGASALVIFYGLFTLSHPAMADVPMPSIGTGLPLSMIAGLGAVGMAFADGSAEDATSLLSKATAALTALFIGIVGLIVATIIAVIAMQVLGIENTADQIALTTVLFGIGLFVVGFGYLLLTGKSLSYLDFKVPSLRDLGVVVLGVIAIFVVLYVASTIIQSLGLPTTDNSITEPAKEGNVGILLALIPLSWLVIGPSEELVYRNVVQKSLYGSFSTTGAVVIASGVFAIAHFFAYFSPNLLATLTTLVIVFFLSMILGIAYAVTENLTVSALIHGTFDAVLFAALYVTLSGDVPTAMVAFLP